MSNRQEMNTVKRYTLQDGKCESFEGATVWSYTAELPVDAQVLAAESGLSAFSVWVRCNPADKTTQRKFLVARDGACLGEKGVSFVGLIRNEADKHSYIGRSEIYALFEVTEAP